MREFYNQINRRLAPGKITKFHWLALVVIMIFSFGIRVYDVGELPAGFFCDEAAIGYNAYCLGEWGIDDSRKPYPLFVKSFVTTLNPVYVYAAILPVKVFGLSEFSVRFTSVIFGTLTILGTFWLVYEFWGVFPALIAALFLSVTPWNFHFSRVAFELVSFPCLFVFGFASLLRSLRKGGWNWLITAVLIGITLYTYVMSIIFIPAFLLVVLILYLPTLWQHKKFLIPGLILFIFISIPAVQNRWATRKDSHFRSSSWVHTSKHMDTVQLTQKFWKHYKRFYSYEFLFKIGDQKARHSIRRHGELYKSFFPLIVLSIPFLMLFPRKKHVLIFWWTMLYPVGAALTKHLIATRSIIGSPLGSIFAAFGFSVLLYILIQIKWKWVSWPLVALWVMIVSAAIGNDSFRYFKIYFTRYAEMSAKGIYGFQYGYRDVIQYMEEHKEQYPQKYLTSRSVNQPQIFIKFYTKMHPDDWRKNLRHGYKIIGPHQLQSYKLDKPTLYAVREDELAYFSEYDIMHTIIDPNGSVDFVIIDVRQHRTFLKKWSSIGLFKKERSVTHEKPYPAPYQTFNDTLLGLNGPIRWKKVVRQTLNINLQKIYMNADPRHRKNPERCCAEAVTYVDMEKQGRYILGISGTNELMVVWINGVKKFGPAMMGKPILELTVSLDKGWNEIAFRSCEESGDWLVAICLSDKDGNALPEFNQQAYPPGDFQLPQKKRTAMSSP